MSTGALYLTDSSGHDILTNKQLTNSEEEEDSVESDVITKPTSSSKFYVFLRSYFKQIQLVFQSVIPDLKSFKSWQILILIFYATFNVVFSILDFNSFFVVRDRRRSLFKWINDTHDDVLLWRRILLCLSGVSAFTNILNVVLVIHGKISSFFWGITGAILYGSYAFAYGYVGDAQLFLFFFLPMQFVGIYIWSKELDGKSTTRVKSLNFSRWVILIVIGATLVVLFYHEIPLFSKCLTSTYAFESKRLPHILDATTNGLSVMGQFLLIACYWEQYIVWTCANLLLIIMYSGLLGTNFDVNMLLVWIMLAINSSCGLYTWYHRWKMFERVSAKRSVKV